MGKRQVVIVALGEAPATRPNIFGSFDTPDEAVSHLTSNGWRTFHGGRYVFSDGSVVFVQEILPIESLKTVTNS